MAVHEADSYRSKKHQGTTEEGSKREHNRIHAPQATSGPKSKDSGTKAANKGESARKFLAQKGLA